jgi:DNA-binding transcriptional MerR regulator
MADSLLTLRDYARLAPWNIRDLSTIAGGILDASGVTLINAAARSHLSDRTIRFYVTGHLMSAPDGRGTAATYSYRHLLQLLAIKLRQMEGATLIVIERELAEQPGDVLEKRVAATLRTIPPLDELMATAGTAPRGRVARLLAIRGREAAHGAASPATSRGVVPSRHRRRIGGCDAGRSAGGARSRGARSRRGGARPRRDGEGVGR